MSKALYVDKNLIGEKIEKSGLKIGFICDKLAISRTGFNKKLEGVIPFKVPEVFVLCSLLAISEEEKANFFYTK